MSNSSPGRPAIGMYVPVYLDREAPAIYDQIRSIRRYDVHVFYQALSNISQYPMQALHSVAPGPPPFSWRRWWREHVGKEAPLTLSGSLDVLEEELAFWRACLLHIYFADAALSLLSLLARLDIPVIVSVFASDAETLSSAAGLAPVFRTAARILVDQDATGQSLLAAGCAHNKIVTMQTLNESNGLDGLYDQILAEVPAKHT